VANAVSVEESVAMQLDPHGGGAHPTLACYLRQRAVPLDGIDQGRPSHLRRGIREQPNLGKPHHRRGVRHAEAPTR